MVGGLFSWYFLPQETNCFFQVAMWHADSEASQLEMLVSKAFPNPRSIAPKTKELLSPKPYCRLIGRPFQLKPVSF